MTKGPYPLGDIAVIGGRIGCQWPIPSPILSPIPLWVWPIYWVTGRREDCLLISSMFDISLPTDLSVTAVSWRSVAQGQSNLMGMPLKPFQNLNFTPSGICSINIALSIFQCLPYACKCKWYILIQNITKLFQIADSLGPVMVDRLQLNQMTPLGN